MLFFIKERSYEIVKLFINQIVLSVFGTALTLAAAGENRTGLRVGSSVFAILFYLFICHIQIAAATPAFRDSQRGFIGMISS